MNAWTVSYRCVSTAGSKPDWMAALRSLLAMCMVIGPATAVGLPSPARAGGSAGWSLVPYAGLSVVDDQLADAADGIAGDSRLDIAVESGFSTALGLRYHYASRWSAELLWEYRSNDSDTRSVDSGGLRGGNYASSIVYLNGRYELVDAAAAWIGYIGFGMGVIQEIDLDSENPAGERSFSDRGGLGYQLFTGVERDLATRLFLAVEVRYSDFGKIDLEEEGGSGQLRGLEYTPLTAQLGLGWRF